MPFESKAQRGFFYAQKARGEFSAKMVSKWERHTPKGAKLPEHVKKRRK